MIGIGGGMSRLHPYFEAVMRRAVEEGRIKNRPGPRAIYFSTDHYRAAARGGLDASRPKLMGYLQRIHARPAYKKALERGGPYDLLS